MNKKHRPSITLQIVLICIFLSSFSVSAQNLSRVNLDSCIALAVRNYPLYTHAQRVQTQSDNKIRQINADMIPQLSLATQATFQSEVTEFDMPGFSIPTTPKDNYSFGLEINQVLYDFGKFTQRKAVERAKTASDIQKNEVNLYSLRATIVQLYSEALLTRENIKILDSYKESIKIRYADMESAVANGVVLQSNLDILFAEMQRTNQRIIEASSNLLAAEQKLVLYTHAAIDTATVLAPINTSDIYSANKALRPEVKQFNSQIKLLDEQIELEQRNKMPRLYLFGEGAYGRPGYNILNHDLRMYGTVGVGLRWNLNNLHSNTISAQNLTIDKDIIKEQKSLFEIQQNSELIEQQNEINKFAQLIDTDTSILEKYTSITATAADQLNNGIITSTNYLTQLHAQKQAELNKQIHIIQRQLAVVKYNLTAGTN